MDTEKQPQDETIAVEKPVEEKPAQTIADTVGDLVSSSATLIAHSAEAVVGRIKEATIGSPAPAKGKATKKRKPAKNRKAAPPAAKAKKNQEKDCEDTHPKIERKDHG
jgi:hypothetical protein